jgi:hypothetical protein
LTALRDGAEPDVAPDRIMELGLGFWAAKALLSAVELGLFTELARCPMDGEALRRRLGLHERGARDFFDALVALGMLERRDGVYRNTAETDRFLDRAKPSYIGGILEMANERLYPFWARLTDALRSGRPQSEAGSGGGSFEALYQDPARMGGFLRAMTGLSAATARAIATRFPWDRYGTFVDVGTAEGACRSRWPWPTRTSRAAGSTCPRCGPSSSATLPRSG